jgi:hypothetical protein
MKYNTHHLLDWFQEIPFKDIVRIFPHSRLMTLQGDDIEEELMHLEEIWCRKSIEERDFIKKEISTKSWEDLSWEKQEKLEESFFIPVDATGLFIDEHKRPYIQTANGKEYCSARKSYDYSIKN